MLIKALSANLSIHKKTVLPFVPWLGIQALMESRIPRYSGAFSLSMVGA
jgi:hypothetical protein